MKGGPGPGLVVRGLAKVVRGAWNSESTQAVAMAAKLPGRLLGLKVEGCSCAGEMGRGKVGEAGGRVDSCSADPERLRWNL